MTKPNDSTLSNYPAGFQGGVSIRNVPILNTYAGKVFWVNSNGGSDTNIGTHQRPMATIGGALALCVADRGDIIMCKAGHAETITAAAQLALNVACVAVVGLGQGSDRPTLTFSTATTASVTVAAKNVTVQNIVGIGAIASLVNPINILSGSDDCSLDIEWQDSTAVISAVSAVVATTIKRLSLKLKYKGWTTNTTCVNPVKLAAVTGGRISIDFTGLASTAVINFVTTLSTDIVIDGYMYVFGITNGSQDVVDTITGSTWFADIYDGAAGGEYTGGSAVAFAANSLNAAAAVPTANATANTLERDVVGNKTDAAVEVVGTTKSLMAYMKGSINAQEAFAVSSNNGTMVTGATIFTVAGGPIMVLGLCSICLTANNATASTLQYESISTLGTLTGTISGATATLASAVAGTVVTLIGTALSTAPVISATGVGLMTLTPILVQAGTINIVVGVGSTTGTWAHYLRYVPMAAAVTVV